MAQATINIGTSPNDGTGDTLRTSFTKINENFGELYVSMENSANAISLFTNNIYGWEDTISLFNHELSNAYILININFTTTNAAYNMLNSAYFTTNSAYAVVNAAFGVANAALPNATGSVFTGTLYFPSGNIGIGTTTAATPLTINQGGVTPVALYGDLIDAEGTQNNTVQIQVRNASNGVNSSTDFVATSDNGTDTTNYIDLGINSSNYSLPTWTINGKNDGYLYTSDSNLSIGTANSTSLNKFINFFVNGSLSSNEAMRIQGYSGGANVGIGTTNPQQKLDVNGSINVSNSVIVSNGFYTKGIYNGSYADGIVVEYANGNGRISVGAGDNVTFYSGGTANIATLTISPYGTVNVNSATLIVSGQNVLASIISANNYSGQMSNSVNAWANTVGISGNAYANLVGTSGNNWSNVYANTVGTNANNWSNVYSNTVGTNANNWSNTYANTVGTNANNWSNTKLSNTDNMVFNGNLFAANGFIANNGFYSSNNFNGTYTDGIVVDYVTGNGRISVGPSDGITFYNGNVANTMLLSISSTGTLNVNSSTLLVGGTNVLATFISAGANSNNWSNVYANTVGTNANTYAGYISNNRAILAKTASYNVAITDVGSVVAATGTIYVPNAVFSAGNTMYIFNNTSTSITIANNIGVSLRAGGLTTGNRTLAANGLAYLICVQGIESGGNTFVMSGTGLT